MFNINFLHFLLISLLTLFNLNLTRGYAIENQTCVCKTDTDAKLETRNSPLTATSSMNPDDIHFYVYSDPGNPKKYVEVFIDDIPSLTKANFTPGPVTILAIPHGGRVGPMIYLKNAYLSKGFRNIVLLDYHELVTPENMYSFLSYYSSLNNIPIIGKKGADFINFLQKNNVITSGDQVHIVGFSIGAHSASSIGYSLQKIYKMKLGRMTGLDVAGPFNQYLKKRRFRKGNAKFADAIHTDGDVLGTMEAVGHADFYPNGGTTFKQVGCKSLNITAIIACTHTTAVGIFAKSITKELEFDGCSCRGLPANRLPLVCARKRGKCENKTIVGQYCPSSARGNFYVVVKTNLSLNDKILNERP